MTAALNPADDAVLEQLAAALGPGGVAPVEPRYLEEPRGRQTGRAAAVLKPASVEEVAAAVRVCAAARVGIVPYSGGTGLVGGQIFGAGPLPVILSFERMARIRDLDVTDNVLVAEAGVVLADVQAAARSADRLFPLSLASEGSARIGGLLATNAGGVGVLRYGSARDLCLGVEAVLADGQVLHGLRRVVKDNLGYDLRHLLIGAEGTLGLITAASLKLHPLPDETATAWIAVASPVAALELLHAARAALGNTLSAFELISAVGLTSWPRRCRRCRCRRRRRALGSCCSRPPTVAAARSAGGSNRCWRRRSTPGGAGRAGRAERGAARGLLGRARGDSAREPADRRGREPRHRGAAGAAGGFHRRCRRRRGRHRPEPAHQLLRAPRRRQPALQRLPAPRPKPVGLRGGAAAMTATVHDLVHARGGSVAAEHGVGRIKRDDLVRYGDPGALAAMRAIKAALDPVGILNPGAVLAGAWE